MIKTSSDEEPCCDPSKRNNDVVETTVVSEPPPEHHPFKIVAELRPQDAYFLQKTRGATIVPTYSIEGQKDRVIGSPLSIPASTSQEYQNVLRSSEVTSVFPRGSRNRALEVIY